MTEYTGLEEAVREIVSCIVTQVEDNHAKHLTEELRLQSRKLDDYAATIQEQAKEIAEHQRVNKNLRENINQHYDRYWEERWRTEKEENEKLRARISELEAVCSGLSMLGYYPDFSKAKNPNWLKMWRLAPTPPKEPEA